LVDAYKVPVVVSLGVIAIVITLSALWDRIFPTQKK
jgi:nucleoside recognition membrane protein YjiH